MRTVVAMSGGVDSSVAAALLVERGHDVVGLSMQLYDHRDPHHAWGSCCTLDDLRDASRVAARIGIPHYILNFEEAFQQEVVSDFVREYAVGRTPLPCAHCNSDLKFSALLEKAHGLQASALATGHYARVTQGNDGRWRLHRGRDADKDQSYFLFGLTQAQLASALFPVGELTKLEVRAHAQRIGLPVAEKPDSQEICFIPDHDYARFVETRIVPQEGTFVDEHGMTIGSHGGVHRFTVGQRKGLGLSNQGAPLYVLRIDASAQQVTVGPRASLERTHLTASSVNWVSTAPPTGPVRVEAQIRHRHPAAAATVCALEAGRADVLFETPQLAVSPGQAVVFYDGDTVIGGGWID